MMVGLLCTSTQNAAFTLILCKSTKYKQLKSHSARFIHFLNENEKLIRSMEIGSCVLSFTEHCF